MKTTWLGKIKEKLQLVQEPFLTRQFLDKLLSRFAPWYSPYHLIQHKIVSLIRRNTLYRNLMYDGIISNLAIIGKYCEHEDYMIGWLRLYNKYHFTTQLADRITVYTTKRSGKRTIAWAKIIFRKARSSFFRWMKKESIQWVEYMIMSPERALIQYIKDSKWKIAYTDDIIRHLGKSIDTKKLLQITKQHTSKTTQALIHKTLEQWQQK